MVYTTTRDLLQHFKNIVKCRNISGKDLAKNLGVAETTLYSRMSQKNMSLDMLNELCISAGYELDINFIEIKKDDTN